MRAPFSVQCEVPLAKWAVIYGALLLSSGGFGIVSAVTFFFARVAGYALYVVSAAAGAGGFGVLIWGSVLAFSFDRWQRIVVSQALPSPCDKTLYHPIASVIIVSWVLYCACRLAHVVRHAGLNTTHSFPPAAALMAARVFTALYFTCAVPCGDPLWPCGAALKRKGRQGGKAA